ncbi:MAG TPA: hypothetical protein VK778_06675 [Solirubrobacteraceae bacterium]|nr:hypothetical protein [Solirubrobacteraceae bacterium]
MAVRTTLGVALAVAAGALAWVVVLPASASATPAPIALDAPENGTPPQIAYDPTTETTYVAWSSQTGTGIDLCVLPADVTACAGGGPVLLTDSHFTGSAAPVIGGLVVLPGGEATVIGATAQGGVGSLAWASPAGGAAFLSGEHGLENGGEPISPVSLYYPTGNAVALSSGDVGLLGSLDADNFSDSTLTTESPAFSEPNSNPGGLFPRKAQDTDGPEIGAEPAPAPAAAGSDVVVGVGDNFAGPPEALPGCLNKEGTGFGVSVGKVDGTSNATGTLNDKALPGYGVLACSALAPVLASGGQDGIGLVEEEGNGIDGAGSEYTLDYHPFDATATGGSFGPGVELANVTQEVLDGVDSLDLSEDSSTGVYALWESGKAVLDYSGNGGAKWDGAVVTPIPYTADGVIAGVGSGNAEIAYAFDPGTGTQVFLQAVNYQELATPPPTPTSLTTSQTSGTTKGASITIPAGTIGESDAATVAGANASTAVGTVDYALYGNSSCTGTPTVSDSATVSGGIAAPFAVSTPLPQGTYYWRASYSGNASSVGAAGNQASASACGSEVLTVTPATTLGGTAASTGTTVTVTITCAVVPCTVTITITVDPPATASAARKKKRRHAITITLGTGKFTITSKGPHKLTVHLTKAGRHYLSVHHGRASAKLLISEKANGGTFLTTRTITITPARHKHKK